MIWFGWLVGFYGISTFVDNLMPNPFYTNNQFYFKQFSLELVHILIKQFNQTVLSQTFQFSISKVFVHKQLNVKTILFQAVQFY